MLMDSTKDYKRSVSKINQSNQSQSMQRQSLMGMASLNARQDDSNIITIEQQDEEEDVNLMLEAH